MVQQTAFTHSAPFNAPTQPSFGKRLRAVVAGVLAAAATGLCGLYAGAFGLGDQLPFVYGDPALVDQQPGVGTQSHVVRVISPDRVRSKDQIVLWIAPLAKNGTARMSQVYPYALVPPGLSRDVTLDVGGKNDLGTRYRAQVCDVSGEAMQRVNAFLLARVAQDQTWKRLSRTGIDVSPYDGDFSCPREASVYLTRTS